MRKDGELNVLASATRITGRLISVAPHAVAAQGIGGNVAADGPHVPVDVHSDESRKASTTPPAASGKKSGRPTSPSVDGNHGGDGTADEEDGLQCKLFIAGKPVCTADVPPLSPELYGHGRSPAGLTKREKAFDVQLLELQRQRRQSARERLVAVFRTGVFCFCPPLVEASLQVMQFTSSFMGSEFCHGLVPSCLLKCFFRIFFFGCCYEELLWSC